MRVRSLSYWTTKEVPTIVLTKAFDFTGGSDGKASACNVGDPGSTPGSGRSPGEGNGQPTPVFLPGESQGWGSLVGCCLWGHTELDTTEAT